MNHQEERKKTTSTTKLAGQAVACKQVANPTLTHTDQCVISWVMKHLQAIELWAWRIALQCYYLPGLCINLLCMNLLYYKNMSISDNYTGLKWSHAVAIFQKIDNLKKEKKLLQVSYSNVIIRAFCHHMNNGDKFSPAFSLPKAGDT